MKTLCVSMLIVCSTAVALQAPAEIDPGMQNIVQVAIVCRDVEATSKRWAALLGVNPPAIHTTRPGGEVKMTFHGRPATGQAKIAFFRIGQLGLEIMEPLGPDTSWREYLDKNGEGVQHIAFRVQDLEGTVKRVAGMGMPVSHQGRFDADTGSYTYLDSKALLGVTLELLHPDGKK